jgi:hypothetical protein
MSIIHAETPAETVVPPMKDAAIIVLIDELRQMQEKAHELAARQIELTRQIETALQDAGEARQKTVADRNDVGGEA